MPGLITAWDDEPTEYRDYPTSRDVVRDTYPTIDVRDYSSRDELKAEIWNQYSDNIYTYYDASGDALPELATIQAIEHAATVLWAMRQQEPQT